MNYLSQNKPDRDDKKFKPAASEPRLAASPALGLQAQDMVTTFGRGLLITGNIVCSGAVQVLGRVNGEIRAAHLVISEGATVEGQVLVQDAVIQGTFKGTIHGSSVKLQGNAVVEGEIHNKSLTIEPNALFVGVSHRLEQPVEAPTMDDVNAQASQQPAPIDAGPVNIAPDQVASVEMQIDDEILG